VRVKIHGNLSKDPESSKIGLLGERFVTDWDDNMEVYSFEAQLKRPEGIGTWTYFDLPAGVAAGLNARNRVRVKGTINGVSFRNSTLPHGDGSHYVVVKKEIREAAGVTQGDLVRITLEVDLDQRTLTLPDDLRSFLEDDVEMKAAFIKLSYSHQKEYVDWIVGARQAATRQKRIEKISEMLRAGKTPKSRPSE
jgi:hypothetical protein